MRSSEGLLLYDLKSQDMKASECKCCVCGKQAVAFWPVIDPDIPADPYCRKCLDKEKHKVMMKLLAMNKK